MSARTEPATDLQAFFNLCDEAQSLDGFVDGRGVRKRLNAMSEGHR
jgi:hypothetical protein